MHLTTTPATPGPLPVLPTTGPADWVGLPLARFTWDTTSPREVFLTREGVSELEGVTSLEAALTAASRESYRQDERGTIATAVLQAKDGTFYLGTLGTGPDARANNGGYFFPRRGNTQVESVTALVDALKAVVGGTSWVRLSQQAGDAPVPTDV